MKIVAVYTLVISCYVMRTFCNLKSTEIFLETYPFEDDLNLLVQFEHCSSRILKLREDQASVNLVK